MVDDGKACSASHRSGFTLIELSIVLVVIGLLVGGVLVGRDLIKAAEIRATVGQIEKYNAAVNTFRTKYSGIPGDLTSRLATQFGMMARSGAVGHGDGNGMIEHCFSDEGLGMFRLGCEGTLFWKDLSFANLIDGSFSAATDSPVTNLTPNNQRYLPDAKLGKGNFILVFYVPGDNGADSIPGFNGIRS